MRQRRQPTLDNAYLQDREPFVRCGDHFLTEAGVSAEAIAHLSAVDRGLIGLESLQAVPLVIARDLLTQAIVEARESQCDAGPPVH